MFFILAPDSGVQARGLQFPAPATFSSHRATKHPVRAHQSICSSIQLTRARSCWSIWYYDEQVIHHILRTKFITRVHIDIGIDIDIGLEIRCMHASTVGVCSIFFTCMHVCVYVCMYVRMYVCVCVCACLLLNLDMRVHPSLARSEQPCTLASHLHTCDCVTKARVTKWRQGAKQKSYS